MTGFAIRLADLIRDRGIKSDEQLAQRAMRSQAPGMQRINVHARTINNWRNGRSRPRSLEDRRLVLVLKVLAPSQEEMSALAKAFDQPEPENRSDWRRRSGSALMTMKRHRLFLASFLVLALSGIVTFAVYRGDLTRPLYLAEIPPDQLNLSKDGFVLPHSQDRFISRSELEKLSGWELYVARNEIFARHGRPFVQPSSVCLQKHFDRWAQKSGNQAGWYVKRSGMPLATDLEYKNATFIRDFECRVRGGQYTCNGMLNPCR